MPRDYPTDGVPIWMTPGAIFYKGVLIMPTTDEYKQGPGPVGKGPRHAITTDELLAERGKTHGDFSDHARITQGLKDVMYSTGRHDNKLSQCQLEALDMITHKIGRILSGDPNFRDHWDDIAGYAKLVAERCPR